MAANVEGFWKANYCFVLLICKYGYKDVLQEGAGLVVIKFSGSPQRFYIRSLASARASFASSGRVRRSGGRLQFPQQGQVSPRAHGGAHPQAGRRGGIHRPHDGQKGGQGQCSARPSMFYRGGRAISLLASRQGGLRNGAPGRRRLWASGSAACSWLPLVHGWSGCWRAVRSRALEGHDQAGGPVRFRQPANDGIHCHAHSGGGGGNTRRGAHAQGQRSAAGWGRARVTPGSLASACRSLGPAGAGESSKRRCAMLGKATAGQQAALFADADSGQNGSVGAWPSADASRQASRGAVGAVFQHAGGPQSYPACTGWLAAGGAHAAARQARARHRRATHGRKHARRQADAPAAGSAAGQHLPASPAYQAGGGGTCQPTTNHQAMLVLCAGWGATSGNVAVRAQGSQQGL